MGTVTTVTISANDYSVYALVSAPVTEATTFWTGRLGAESTAFLAATSDNKAKSLVTAADWIDRALGNKFTGTQTSDTQPRAWPRDGATKNGTALADGVTPDDVANAQYLLAGILTVNPALALGTGTGSNVKQAKAGSASVQFFSSTLNSNYDTRLPVGVMDLLRPFLGALSTYGAGLASGVDGESPFSEDDFQRSDGFA